MSHLWIFSATGRLLLVLVAVVLLKFGCSADEPSTTPPGGYSLSGRESHRRTHELLNGVLWTQTSAEYQALALQSYRLAEEMLDRALIDPSWTASLEQQSGNFADMPPAVILDVDETVLDNSAFEARLIIHDALYSDEAWGKWCGETNAPPVAGALEFTRSAVEKGVAVFYVTNRLHDLEEATRENLRKHGFPLDSDSDTIYTRGERESWMSPDKTTRRTEIASRYRVLLLVGDNLGDFVSGAQVSLNRRAGLFERHRAMWGSRWIMLPNPLYGSWESALTGFDYGLPDSERLRLKYEALRTLE